MHIVQQWFLVHFLIRLASAIFGQNTFFLSFRSPSLFLVYSTFSTFRCVVCLRSKRTFFFFFSVWFLFFRMSLLQDALMAMPIPYKYSEKLSIYWIIAIIYLFLVWFVLESEWRMFAKSNISCHVIVVDVIVIGPPLTLDVLIRCIFIYLFMYVCLWIDSFALGIYFFAVGIMPMLNLCYCCYVAKIKL